MLEVIPENSQEDECVVLSPDDDEDDQNSAKSNQ